MRRFPFIIDTLNKNCTDLSGVCFIYFFNKYYSMSMFCKKKNCHSVKYTHNNILKGALGFSFKSM